MADSGALIGSCVRKSQKKMSTKQRFFTIEVILKICFLVPDDTFNPLEFSVALSAADDRLLEETGGFSVSFLVGDNDSDDDDQTIPMQIASCDVTDHSSHDATSRNLASRDFGSRDDLVVPESEQIESIKVNFTGSKLWIVQAIAKFNQN